MSMFVLRDGTAVRGSAVQAIVAMEFDYTLQGCVHVDLLHRSIVLDFQSYEEAQKYRDQLRREIDAEEEVPYAADAS